MVSVYGLKDSGRNFEKLIHAVFVKLGYINILEGIWVQVDPVTKKVLTTISQYVDDLQVIAIHEDIDRAEAELRQHLDCQPAEELKRVVGVDYEIGPDYIKASQKDYAESLQPRDGHIPWQPLPSNVLEKEDNSKVIECPKEITEYRSNLGAYAYLASTSRPDLSYSATFFSRSNQQPTEQAERLLQAAMRYAKHTADVSLMIKQPAKDVLRLTCHVDASFGSEHNIYPQTGFVVMHKNVPIAWKSHKQKRVARSTTRAELLALEEAVDYLIYLRPFLELFWPTVHLEVATDSADVVHLLNAVHARPSEKALVHKIREMHGKLMIVLLYALAETVKCDKIIVSHIPGASNVADALTKPMDVSALYKRLLPRRSRHTEDVNFDDDEFDIVNPNGTVHSEKERITPRCEAHPMILRAQRNKPKRLIEEY